MASPIELPVVDLAANDASAALAGGLQRLGFVALANHGCSSTAADGLRLAGDRFFALSREVKQAYVHPSPEANRGHRARGSEALSYSLGEASPPDLFESFNCGDDGRVTGHALMQATPWPDNEVAELRPAAHRWLAEMADLSQRLDQLIDAALDTDLARRSLRGPDTMALIDYRPGDEGPEQPLPGQQRMGAHSDYTTFTILDADPVPGLQIVGAGAGAGAGGEWVDVVPEPGTLLLNVGDLLAMLTNDHWPSTLHRVVPMAAGAAARRRSVAYFHYPDLAELIAPLAAFGEPKYEPVSVEAHLLGKLSAPKVQEPATGVSTVAGRLGSDRS